MDKHKPEKPAYTVPFGSLLPFLIISFGLTWAILALYIFIPRQTAALLGQLTGRHPLFYLATYSPAIAAFIVIGMQGGRQGLARFLGRLLLWRASLGWYVFILLALPLVFIAGSWLKGNLAEYTYPFSTIPALLAALFFMLIKGPVEEFGWRGFALPLLQRKLAPVWAGLLIGIIWGLWHLPVFFIAGTPQSAWPFAPFFLGNIAISLLMTALFNDSRGSLLLPMAFHFQLINPVWPDAQPYDTWLLLLVAVVVIWYKRKDMFHVPGRITAVVPLQPEGPAGSAPGGSNAGN